MSHPELWLDLPDIYLLFRLGLEVGPEPLNLVPAATSESSLIHPRRGVAEPLQASSAAVWTSLQTRVPQTKFKNLYLTEPVSPSQWQCSQLTFMSEF